MHDAVERVLWSAGSQSQSKVFVILDSARDDIIYPRLAESDAQKGSLLIGDQARELAAVAPYLVELDQEDPFTQWLLDQGWGKSWGIFAESEATFIELRHHLRSFLRVGDENGKTLFFRYYDPRVIRVFFPICDSAQLRTMFGPVKQYFVEGEEGKTLIQYSMRDNKLVQNIIQL
ncbi:conserved hypothetical protein [uncultured Desulfobacterium sp.]|uniref:DUF4123 domain-containing protein n=1 Tax=uncultured Desulfobacterium sp. TaxID=201089 RepID=A0A445MTH2_9BACT|nr:conserved hypothetical protein [uncultured Desulfobacterium sp.]